jgi:hypothetical protein
MMTHKIRNQPELVGRVVVRAVFEMSGDVFVMKRSCRAYIAYNTCLFIWRGNITHARSRVRSPVDHGEAIPRDMRGKDQRRGCGLWR